MALLAEKRKEQGLTQEELAGRAGIDRTHVGLLEKGLRRPSLDVAVRLSVALGWPLSDLLRQAEVSERVSEDVPGHGPSPYPQRRARDEHFRNHDALAELTGLDWTSLRDAIDMCYGTLDLIDAEMEARHSPPLAALVELANLSAMLGNVLGAGVAEASNGLYVRNGPHKHPDLLPEAAKTAGIEIKIALETNRPKGHLPKPGLHLVFRYVLADKAGSFTRGRRTRGDTAWIWEVKVGHVAEHEFDLSNTPGDSGKTAVVNSTTFNAMPVVYYVPAFLPYASEGRYRGLNGGPG